MFINTEWLYEKLGHEKVRIVDCRFHLQEKEWGHEQYQQEHIPNAVYFDLEKHLSKPPEKHGGRHPLPELERFQKALEQAGITNEDAIVAYDSGEGMFAARFIWMMQYVGHERLYILNGGFKRWKEAGLPTEKLVPSFPPSRYHINEQHQLLAGYDEVKELSQSGKQEKILIDSRDYNRFAGKEEPIDKKPGHIPGAVNYPWTESFDQKGFKGKEKQQERFGEVDRNKEVIVYCGSGVSAMPNYFALKEAGFDRVKVYIGSYSDWVSYQDNPVGTVKS